MSWFSTVPGLPEPHAIILAFVALTASSVVAPTPSEASHGTNHYVYARISARLAADGHRVEFALQQGRLASSTWGERIFPRARYFPTTTATVDQWLVSSALLLPSWDDPSSATEVRITARLRDNGQVEFALQQLVDGTWGLHIKPRARYFPTTTAIVGQWLISSPLSATLPRFANPDRAVIEAFYRATGGREWDVQTHWLSNRPLDEWAGVDTDSDGRVVRLRLEDNNLSGSIPPELGNLTRLEWLRLEDNNLSGSIPPELGNLSRLESLHLNGNNLTGSIPPALGNLTKLDSLRLDHNDLSGSIPPELANLTGLWSLRLDNNNLTGYIPLELSNLINMRLLNLGHNQLTGPIPPWLGNLTRLSSLSLGDNQLTGPIPSWLGNLINMRTLNLGHNQLSGSIPADLGNLTKLKRLRLHSNNLTGSIPPELGNITDLWSLRLDNNNLTGYIPLAILAYAQTQCVVLEGNNFTPSPPDNVAAYCYGPTSTW